MEFSIKHPLLDTQTLLLTILKCFPFTRSWGFYPPVSIGYAVKAAPWQGLIPLTDLFLRNNTVMPSHIQKGFNDGARS